MFARAGPVLLLAAFLTVPLHGQTSSDSCLPPARRRASRSAADSLRRELDCWSLAVIERRPDSVGAWLGIGLARLELARLKVIAKPGPLQPIGSSYARGAVESFMQVLELDSTSAIAAVHLPDALDLMPAWVPYTQARDALRRTAATPVDRLPPVLLSRARLERETDVRDSTLVLLQRYLAAGGDSAVGELELAREYFARGKTEEGAAAYAHGASHAGLSIEGRNAYRAQLALLATPEEMARFDSLPPDSLGRWIARFWSQRDARVGRPAGARLMEHFRRYEYAFQNFKTIVRRPPGAPSIEILTADVPTGAPDSIDEAMALDQMFGDSVGGSSLLTQHRIPGTDQFDARGPVYIRHGPPDYRVGNWWVYRRSRGNLYLRVVPAVAALPGTLCDYDPWYCFPPTPRLVQLQSAELKRMEEEAFTTDYYAPFYRRDLKPTVELYALHARPGTAGGRLLLVFAIPPDGLTSTAGDSIEGFSYPIRFHLVAAAPDGGRRVDLDTLRTFVTTRPLEGKDHLTGLLELPLPSGLVNVRVTIEEPDTSGARPADARPEVTGGRGVLVGRDSVLVPATDRPSLGDPILGRSGSGVVWASPAGPLPLNPLAAFPTGSRAILYYEAAGLTPGASYRQRVAVTPAKGKGQGITLSFTETATGSRQAFVRALLLKDLRPGRYELTVTLEAPDGPAIERTTPLNVVK